MSKKEHAVREIIKQEHKKIHNRIAELDTVIQEVDKQSRKASDNLTTYINNCVRMTNGSPTPLELDGALLVQRFRADQLQKYIKMKQAYLRFAHKLEVLIHICDSNKYNNRPAPFNGTNSVMKKSGC